MLLGLGLGFNAASRLGLGFNAARARTWIHAASRLAMLPVG